MAILCDDQRLLFIMAPHTGCTAVGVALREHLAGRFVPEQDVKDRRGRVLVPRKHSQLSQLLEHGVVSPESRARLVVASTIRNPFDSLVSDYEQVRKRLKADPDRRPAAAEATANFERWLRFRYGPLGLYSRLRGRKVRKPISWTEGSDVVMRFERLQADFDDLMRHVGVQERVMIPVVNPTAERKRRPYQEYYTPEAQAIVQRVFADVLERYGYRFEPAP